jgi:hypothetical protein
MKKTNVKNVPFSKRPSCPIFESATAWTLFNDKDLGQGWPEQPMKDQEHDLSVQV